MGILDTIFGNSASATAGQQQQQQQQQQTQAPSDTSTAPEPEGLDKFTDLVNFTPDPDKVPKPFDPSTLINADPEALAKQVSQMNFVQGAITKEDAEVIAAGGADAIGVMAKALNTVAQKAFMQATLAAKNISSETLKQSLSHLDTRVDERLRNQQVSSALAEANPALAHPVAKPLIDAVMPKIQAKYPGASPTEVRDMAVSYLMEFANAVNPPKEDKPARAPGEVLDWGEWLNT